MKTINTLCLVLTLGAIAFSAGSLALPWWTIQNSPESRIALSEQFTADYSLFKTVTTTSPDNQTVAVGLDNLTSAGNPQPSFAFMDNSIYMVTVGLALSIPVAVASVLPRISKHIRYIALIGYISMLLLFVTPLYFASELPMAVSGLSSVSPVAVPYGWPSINPSEIQSIWGSKPPVANSTVSNWIPSGRFWIWQPSVGWYLSFSAALLIVTATLVLQLAEKHGGMTALGKKSESPRARQATSNQR